MADITGITGWSTNDGDGFALQYTISNITTQGFECTFKFSQVNCTDFGSFTIKDIIWNNFKGEYETSSSLSWPFDNTTITLNHNGSVTKSSTTKNIYFVFPSTLGFHIDMNIYRGNIIIGQHTISNLDIPILNDTYTLKYNTANLTNYYEFGTTTQKPGESTSINSERPIKSGYAFNYWLGDDNKKYRPGQWLWLDRNLTLTPIWSQKFHYYKTNSEGELEPINCNIKIYYGGDWRDCNIYQYHDGSFN